MPLAAQRDSGARHEAAHNTERHCMPQSHGRAGRRTHHPASHPANSGHPERPPRQALGRAPCSPLVHGAHLLRLVVVLLRCRHVVRHGAARQGSGTGTAWTAVSRRRAGVLKALPKLPAELTPCVLQSYILTACTHVGKVYSPLRPRSLATLATRYYPHRPTPQTPHADPARLTHAYVLHDSALCA